MKPKLLTLEIALVSFAALLLEVSYTRIFSFKASMHFTYLIIGLGLLGIGAGAVLVAVFPRLRAVAIEKLVAISTLAAAAAAGLGYVVVAYTELSTYAFPPSGPALLRLMAVSGALFSTFLAAGVVIASLFASRPESIPRLYFADLVGASLGCAAAIPLMLLISPPGCVFSGAAVFALAGIRPALLTGQRALAATAGVVAVVLAVVAVTPGAQPTIVVDPKKSLAKFYLDDRFRVVFSQWHPIFRVDVVETDLSSYFMGIVHDGQGGATLLRNDGTEDLSAFVERSPRRLVFSVAVPNPRVLVIGSAGGSDILIAKTLGARHITGLELNPVTISLLEDRFADYTGHLPEDDRIEIINAEARSYLRRDNSRYDVIYFGAPDSYAAMNAAQASGFVLVESYLYTVEMIVDSLKHLTDDGIVAIQFGEFSYENKPNRSTRYLATAREAMRELGITDFSKHVLLATARDFPISSTTVVMQMKPFRPEQIEAFRETGRQVPDTIVRHPNDGPDGDGPPNQVISLPDDALDDFHKSYPYEVGPISDDRPYFWHFVPFLDLVSGTPFRAGKIDPEGGMGEATLLSMLGVGALFAAVFLLLPFAAVHNTWRELPRKRAAALYFSMLGLGFMFFEIGMLQKLTLFLGYPTYSLSVTLFSLLVFAGIGSYATERHIERGRRATGLLVGIIAALTLFYQFGLDHIVNALFGGPLPLRIAVVVIALLPLGLCLGTFMPIGLSTVSALTPHKATYVAWGWAVNGFFSVMGSILATILSMAYGFRFLLFLALILYVAAAFALRWLGGGSDAQSSSDYAAGRACAGMRDAS